MSYEPIKNEPIEELKSRVLDIETKIENKVQEATPVEATLDSTQEQINSDVEQRLRRIEELLAL